MQIVWHGLSCVEIASKTPEGEVSILLNPYGQESGLKLPRNLAPDMVALSSAPEGEEGLEGWQGSPFLVRMPGEYEVRSLFLYSIQAPLQKGSYQHAIFRLEQEGMRLAHLGDLDRPLTDDELQQLNNIDILMVPVGGGRVLSPKAAAEVIGQIEPRVVIPMTYKLPGLKESFEPIEAFYKEMQGCRREQAAKYKVSRRDLPEEDILLLVLEQT